ncbi:hypothetical protein [Roseimaritima ulvae]|nr:hypothetical protein [Roseimaritima ulvae]
MEGFDMAANHRLANAIESEFCIKVLTFENYRPEPLPRYVSVHTFSDASGESISDDVFFAIRDWVFRMGWDLSRQLVFNDTVHAYLYPAVREYVSLAYHVTRTSSLTSILVNGLGPGTKDRCNDNRIDPHGNIYITTTLGCIGDRGRENLGTAHWWREHLATNNRFGDPDWTILGLDFSSYGKMQVHQDIWSASGRVIRTREPLKCSIRILG